MSPLIGGGAEGLTWGFLVAKMGRPVRLSPIAQATAILSTVVLAAENALLFGLAQLPAFLASALFGALVHATVRWRLAKRFGPTT